MLGQMNSAQVDKPSVEKKSPERAGNLSNANWRMVLQHDRKVAVFIRDTACFHFDLLNFESQFIESQ